MATSQADVISGLSELTFRGLPPVPCGDASYDFGHDQVERRYPYIDGAGHDNTGRTPIKFTATLYFVNTLEPDLYPTVWNQWRDGLLDGSSAQLDHPDLGVVRARVLQGSVKLSATNRAGIIVSVTFVETNDTVDQPPKFTGPSVDLREAASAADSGMLALGIRPPVYFAGDYSSLFDILNALLAALAAGVYFTAFLNAILGLLWDLEDTVADLDYPQAWPVIYNLHVLEAGLRDLAANAQASNRPTATIALTYETTLDQIATKVGNSVVDLATLNPTLLGKPNVKPGVAVTYYTGT